MKIKICGIKFRENLQEIVKLKPDFLGFNFYVVSPRYIENDLNPGDLALIPRTIKKVGIFVNHDEYEITGIRWKYGLDYVQLHGNESADMCRSLNKSGIQIIKAFRLDKAFDFNTLIPYIDSCRYFLFDTPTEGFGGSGRKFDWAKLEEYDVGHPFFLSGGIKPEDASTINALTIPSLIGVDINSGFELSPGMKDIKRLKTFMKTVSRNS